MRVFCIVFRRGSGFYSKLTLEGSDVYGVFTNNHVLGSLHEAENANATFCYEGSSNGVKVKLRPELIFKTHKVSVVTTITSYFKFYIPGQPHLTTCKACSKRRATAVPNSNEFGLGVARRWHGSGFKRQT